MKKNNEAWTTCDNEDDDDETLPPPAPPPQPPSVPRTARTCSPARRGGIVYYSHHHHVNIVYRYTKYLGPIVYSRHHISCKSRLDSSLFYRSPSIPVKKPRVYRWTNGPMDQWTDGPMDQWTDGPMDQCTNGPPRFKPQVERRIAPFFLGVLCAWRVACLYGGGARAHVQRHGVPPGHRLAARVAILGSLGALRLQPRLARRAVKG